MRTGAIFARGSCRALAWVLALGVAAVLSGGQAVAQTATTVMIAVPDKLVLTPSGRVDVEEGAGETFTVQLQTKVVETTSAAVGASARPDTVNVTVTLSRGAGTDGAHFIVGGIDTHDSDGAGTPMLLAVRLPTELTLCRGHLRSQRWALTPLTPLNPKWPRSFDPTSNKFVSVNAQEDAGIESGVNALVLDASTFTWDHDNDTGTDALELSGARMTIAENDNDSLGVTVSERALTLREGDATGKEYTIKLDSEPEDSVMIKAAVSSPVNANILVSKDGGTTVATSQTLTFTTSNWNRPQTVTVTAGTDSNTTNGSATIKHTAESNDPQYHKIKIRSISVTEIDSVRTVTLTTSADTVDEGKSITITATLGSSDPETPATLSSNVTVKLTRGETPASKDYSVSDIMIAANSTAGATVLTANQDTDASNEKYTLTASASGPGILEIAENKISFEIIDDDTYTLEASNTEVDEGDEVTLTVKVDPCGGNGNGGHDRPVQGLRGHGEGPQRVRTRTRKTTR